MCVCLNIVVFCWILIYLRLCCLHLSPIFYSLLSSLCLSYITNFLTEKKKLLWNVFVVRVISSITMTEWVKQSLKMRRRHVRLSFYIVLIVLYVNNHLMNVIAYWHFVLKIITAKYIMSIKQSMSVHLLFIKCSNHSIRLGLLHPCHWWAIPDLA